MAFIIKSLHDFICRRYAAIQPNYVLYEEITPILVEIYTVRRIWCTILSAAAAPCNAIGTEKDDSMALYDNAIVLFKAIIGLDVNVDFLFYA